MNNKLILLIVAAGVVAFSLAFFRTGDPEIAGLERPVVKLSAFQNDAGAPVAPNAAPVRSRFTKGETKRPPAAAKRKPAARKQPGASNSAANRAGGIRKREINSPKATGLKSRGQSFSKSAEDRNARMEEHRARINDARRRKQLEREREQELKYNDELGMNPELDGASPGMMDEPLMEDPEMGLAAPSDLDLEQAPIE